MKHTLSLTVAIALGIAFACAPYPKDVPTNPAVKAQRFPAGSFDSIIEDHVDRMVEKSRQVFRYDTFGNETFWGASSSFTKQLPAKATAAGDPDLAQNRRYSSG